MADSEAISGPRDRRVGRAALALSLLAFGGVAFSWTFHRSLAAVPPANYEARDDAVVTLSHARNLVDFGFIGTNPSGERIEGFSTPLQFWVAVAVYAATTADVRTFFRVQTEIGTVLLGIVFAGLLSAGLVGRRGFAYRVTFIVLALAGSAAILASSRVFLLWHASGMENVYKTALLVALLWSLDAMLRTGRIQWASAALVLMAALSRIDSMLAVGVLLSVFVCLWWLRYRNTRAARFLIVSFGLWVLYMVWRRWYFAEWIPNTALAQGISVSQRIARAWKDPQVAWVDWSQWVERVTPTLHVFQIAWIAVLLPLAWKQRLALERGALILAGVAACLAHYFVFGPVRLDVARPVTELAVYATALAPFVLLAIDNFGLRHLVAGVLVLTCSTLVAVRRAPDRTEIGWGAELFEPVADQVEALAREHGIPRPSFANADLGAVSWRKHFNVVDFGLLGSAVTPRVRDIGQYLAEVAKPDIIEMHYAWSCLYRDLFTNRTFLAEYTPVTSEHSEWLKTNCADAPEARTGVWLRLAVMKDAGTPERLFLDTFQRSFSAEAVRQELSTCTASPGQRPCAYVGRTLFRFVPELKGRRVYAQIATMLREDPRLAIEHAYFTSSMDPTWWKALLRSGLEWTRSTKRPLDPPDRRRIVFGTG